MNADLATLKDADAIAGADTISLAVTDGFGNTASTTIAVTASARPVITVPAGETIGVGHTLAVSGVSVAEAGATGESFTVYVNDGEGLLTGTGTGLSGSGTKQLTIEGTLAQVNADLATIKDLETGSGIDTIDFSLGDSLGNTAAATIAVTVNSLPVITAPATASVSTGESTAISGRDPRGNRRYRRGKLYGHTERYQRAALGHRQRC